MIAAVGALGVGAQWIAWRTGWPAIVLMLAAGFIAGPITGLIDPETVFGDMLDPMISVGVGLILFEGGLNLQVSRLRREQAAIRRLVLWGALLTLCGSLPN